MQKKTVVSADNDNVDEKPNLIDQKIISTPTAHRSLLPKRYEMALLLFSGVVVVYTLRVNMSVAAQKMRDELGWSESQKGLVLSSFYWGYALGQLPASRIAQLYGAQQLFGWSVFLPAVLTLLVPFACRTSFVMTLAIRTLIGFFESATFPAFFHFIPIWIPVSEKTLTVAFIASGMYCGEIIGFGLSGMLATSPDLYIGGFNIGGWPSIFYLFGLTGLLWFPFWLWLARESPQQHPYISEEELLFMLKDSAHNRHHTDSSQSSAAAGAYTQCSTDDDVPTATDSSRPTVVTDCYTPNPMIQPLLAPATAADEEAVVDVKEATQRQQSQSMQIGAFTRAELAAGTPWKQFLSHPIALGLLMGSFCYGWIGFTLLSEMPSYLTDILGFDLQSAGMLCVFPYLALFVASLCSGQLFSHLQHSGSSCSSSSSSSDRRWSLRSIRTLATLVAYVGSSAGLVLCGFMDNKYIAYAFMIVTQACYSAAQAGIGCAYTDIAPNYSSSLNSLGNTLGAVAGILGPIIVSALVAGEEEPVWGWRAAFLLTFAISVAVTLYWMIVMRFEIVPLLNEPAVASKAA